MALYLLKDVQRILGDLSSHFLWQGPVEIVTEEAWVRFGSGGDDLHESERTDRAQRFDG
jgi:hypothetical protein